MQVSQLARHVTSVHSGSPISNDRMGLCQYPKMILTLIVQVLNSLRGDNGESYDPTQWRLKDISDGTIILAHVQTGSMVRPDFLDNSVRFSADLRERGPTK